MTEQPTIDITKMTEAELYKLAFEQQQVVTNALAQMQQAQANIAAIQEQIKKLPKEEK